MANDQQEEKEEKKRAINAFGGGSTTKTGHKAYVGAETTVKVNKNLSLHGNVGVLNNKKNKTKVTGFDYGVGATVSHNGFSVTAGMKKKKSKAIGNWGSDSNASTGKNISVGYTYTWGGKK